MAIPEITKAPGKVYAGQSKLGEALQPELVSQGGKPVESKPSTFVAGGKQVPVLTTEDLFNQFLNNLESQGVPRNQLQGAYADKYRNIFDRLVPYMAEKMGMDQFKQKFPQIDLAKFPPITDTDRPQLDNLFNQMTGQKEANIQAAQAQPKPQQITQQTQGQSPFSQELPKGLHRLESGRPEQTQAALAALAEGQRELAQSPEAYSNLYNALQQGSTRNFYENIVPRLAETFTGLGPSAQSSSAFQGALGAAGSGLQSELDRLKAELGVRQIERGQDIALQKLGYGFQPLQQYYQEPYIPKFIEQVAPGLLQGLMGLGSTALGSYLGNRGQSNLINQIAQLAQQARGGSPQATAGQPVGNAASGWWQRMLPTLGQSALGAGLGFATGGPIGAAAGAATPLVQQLLPGASRTESQLRQKKVPKFPSQAITAANLPNMQLGGY